MPILNEIRTGNEIGYRCNCKYIFYPCDTCKQGHWVQYIKGKANITKCRSCSGKQRRNDYNYDYIEKLKLNGIKCKRCNQIFPATKEYFPIEKHSRLGLKLICKPCYNLKAREYNLKTGKTKLDKATYLRNYEIKRELNNKRFNELVLNRGNIKGIVGEIKYSRDIGIKGGYLNQWLPCNDCGKERWVRLVKNKPKNLYCKNCGAIRAGIKSKGRTIISSRIKRIIETGLRECNKCHKSLPSNTDFFLKSKTKLGIGSVCNDCFRKNSREKLKSLGKVENICSICGRKKLVYNTGKQKSICNGCSQKLSGKQKLPRPNKKGKPFKYIPREYTICASCRCEYPINIKYFRKNKMTKSGFYLKRCRKCLSKAKYLKIKSNPKNIINNRIRNSISQSLNGTKKGCHWEILVGWTIEQLIKHLKRHFTEGMSWENYGAWHIDHVIPQSAFHFNSPDDIDFKRCWDLSNLQPLWAKDNEIKGSKILKTFQPSLKIKH